MHYKGMKIVFKKDVKPVIIVKDIVKGWTDYEFITIGQHGFFVVKNGEMMIATYALDEIFSIEQIPGDESDYVVDLEEENNNE